MRLLLFSISIIYSFIFYIFYNFSNGLDIFGNKLNIGYSISTLSTNLLFETFFFFIVGIIFYIYFIDFSGKKRKKKNVSFSFEKYNLNINNILIIFFTFVLFFTISYYFNNFISNKALLFNLLGLIFNFSLYFFIIKIKYFINRVIIIKMLSLIFLYISSISGVYYLFMYDINYIILTTLIYSILFNFKIHIKYSNYISLIFGILLLFFIVYYLLILKI